MPGCSSHSGRRTSNMRTPRLVIRTGGSLGDIQELVDHRDLGTTRQYSEGDRASQRALISLLFASAHNPLAFIVGKDYSHDREDEFACPHC